MPSHLLAVRRPTTGPHSFQVEAPGGFSAHLAIRLAPRPDSLPALRAYSFPSKLLYAIMPSFMVGVNSDHDRYPGR
jgi:hypothetical protein